MSRPVHLRVSHLGLALIGGTLGTASREGLSLLMPAIDGIPVAIVAINLLGAFLLGVFLETLTRRGPDEGPRRMLRILIATGFMGGFTTYSALAADTAVLLGDGRVGSGLAYGLGTVVPGGLATWAGIVIGSLTHRSPLADDAEVAAGGNEVAAAGTEAKAPIDPDDLDNPATADDSTAGAGPTAGVGSIAADGSTAGAGPTAEVGRDRSDGNAGAASANMRNGGRR